MSNFFNLGSVVEFDVILPGVSGFSELSLSGGREVDGGNGGSECDGGDDGVHSLIFN